MATDISTYSDASSTSHFMDQFGLSSAGGLSVTAKESVYVVDVELRTVPAETFVLSPNTTTFLYLDGNFNSYMISEADTGTSALLYKITTDGSTITSIEDQRGSTPTSRNSAW